MLGLLLGLLAFLVLVRFGLLGMLRSVGILGVFRFVVVGVVRVQNRWDCCRACWVCSGC